MADNRVVVVITKSDGSQTTFPLKSPPRSLDSGLVLALITMVPKEWL